MHDWKGQPLNVVIGQSWTLFKCTYLILFPLFCTLNLTLLSLRLQRDDEHSASISKPSRTVHVSYSSHHVLPSPAPLPRRAYIRDYRATSGVPVSLALMGLVHARLEVIYAAVKPIAFESGVVERGTTPPSTLTHSLTHLRR